MSTPKLVSPKVYSFTELVVGKECRKRPQFLVIIIAAKITDRPFTSRKWGVVKGSYLQGEADRTGDPVVASEVFHAIYVILSLKLGDHKGLALLVHGLLLKRITES